MTTDRIIDQAIDYILQYRREEIHVEDVARHCHFSKYHFCRLFKARTGESVYGFLRRVRLEESAFRLKVEEERSITEIGADMGYSSSNYSSAFRQHYHMAPAAFRRRIRQTSMAHPFFHHEDWQVESFAQCSQKITLEQVPDYRVLYERHFGSYEELSRDWGRFIQKHRAWITEDTCFFERTYDDPAVTETDRCLSDICMSVGEGDVGEDACTCILRGGRCAAYHFRGHAKHIYAAYQTLFLVWLPDTPYELDTDRSLFDRYHVVDGGRMYMELDICLPVRERARGR
ncbi:MAG: AraC family transcriptional regulator [Lachnospiraceae bacterium]|nr:AraC family transcriptional regulator [Lachnospiraceae bacterium]